MQFGIQLFGVLEHTRKDFRREGEKLIPATVGRGDIDIAACFQFARAMGVPQIVDQDEFDGEPVKACGECLRALRSLGQVRDRTVSYLNVLDTATGQVRTLCGWSCGSWTRTAPTPAPWRPSLGVRAP